MASEVTVSTLLREKANLLLKLESQAKVKPALERQPNTFLTHLVLYTSLCIRSSFVYGITRFSIWETNRLSQITDSLQGRIQTLANAIEQRDRTIAQYKESIIQARQEAYGSIGDQLDMMYKDEVDGTTTWKDHVAQVKTDNPKPS